MDGRPPSEKAKRPSWLIPSLLASLVLVVGVVVLAVVLTSGDDMPAVEGAATTAPGAEARAGAPDAASTMRAMDDAAAFIGAALAAVSTEEEAQALARDARREAGNVARSILAMKGGVRDPEGLDPDQLAVAETGAALVAYLENLSALADGDGGITQGDLESDAQAVEEGVARAAALNESINAPSMTAAVLGRTDGLVAAAAPAAAAQSPVDSFESMTGNLRCEDRETVLRCSSTSSGIAIDLPESGEPSYSTGLAEGGRKLPYDTTWTSASGSFTCDSSFYGFICRNANGSGFFIERTKTNLVPSRSGASAPREDG